ncbi:MAG: glycosyltransferase family 1 protein [Actinomycetota bacterium]|nr:glycosyltransferase family 1 protein [Actinomycetota bacterium]
MKIGMDVSTVLNHGINIGSGRYIINLLECLISLNDKSKESCDLSNGTSEENDKNHYGKNSFVLTGRYTNDSNLHYLSGLKKKHPNTKIKLKIFPVKNEELEKWNNRNFPPLELKGLFNVDVLHCPDYLIPPTINKNIILTVHDLSFYRFPEFNFEWFIKKYQAIVSSNARRAKKIIADSNSTKQDIVNFMNIDPRKIEVVYMAADKKFRKLEPDKIKKEVPAKFNIKKDYILSVGTIEPRKNFKTLIKAFDIFKKSFKVSENYNLVIAGKTGWKSEETFKELDKSLFKDEIVFTGEVNDDDLIQLYNQASLFVYPSIFEGFGLPVLEAMSCNLPVIASDSSSIPEIFPNDKFLINPFDEKQMAERMNLVLKNQDIRNSLADFSIKNSRKFSWEKTASQTIDIYKSCIKV